MPDPSSASRLPSCCLRLGQGLQGRVIGEAVPLDRLTGEDDCGIYAEVVSGGKIAEGDAINVP